MNHLKLPISGARFRLETGANPGDIRVIRLVDSTDVGALAVSVEDGVVTIDSLCIEVEHRSYGAGSEAARLLSEAASAAGARKLRAWAHPNLGLSAYFWGRMGLHPLHGPGPEGGIWFERTLV